MESEGNWLQSFPTEITQNIFSKLPMTYLTRCSSLNKSIARMITNNDDQDFAFKHFSHAVKETGPCLFLFYGGNIDFLETNLVGNRRTHEFKEISGTTHEMALYRTVIGSCNGYLCLSTIVSTGIRKYVVPSAVYNPFTKHLLKFPQIVKKALWASGFGFHPKTKEYKIVLINVRQDSADLPYLSAKPWYLQPELYVQVLTLGSEQWRRVSEVPITLSMYRMTSENLKGVCLDGSMHWLSKQTKNEHHHYYVIVVFNLATEIFEELELPDRMAYQQCTQLLVVKGNLAAVVPYQYGQLEIWVMKDYQVKESWHLEFVIQDFYSRVCKQVSSSWHTRHPTVLGVLKDGRILMTFSNASQVLCYDINTESFIDFHVEGIRCPRRCMYYQMIAHFGTLIRISTPTT